MKIPIIHHLSALQKRIIVSVFFLIGLLIFSLYLLNYYPLHHTQLTHRLQHTNTTQTQLPVTHFQFTATQNTTAVLDHPIASNGCSVRLSLKSGSSTNIAIMSGKAQRTFLIYLPPQYSNTTKHALVLNFHGYASNNFIQQRISHFNDLANKDNFIVVYPQGTTGILAARGWNTGLHPTITANDVLFVSNAINQLQRNLCIDQNQIYAVGFSNGGGLVAKLACNLSDRVAAFASISGSYVTAFSHCNAKRAVSIIEFHGTSDTTVPYTGLAKLKEFSTQLWLNKWAKIDNCDTTPTIKNESQTVTQYTWNGCKDNAAIVHYKIQAGRHRWPSRHFELSENRIITQGTASQIIWTFFMQHPLQATQSASVT